MSLLALVHVDDLLGVDGQVLVGVDHHAEEPRVRLQKQGGGFSWGWEWRGVNLDVDAIGPLLT